MKILKDGDKSIGACVHCKKISSITFRVRNTTIKENGETFEVTNILVSVCDTCDKIVGIPQQSDADIAKQRTST